MDGNNANNEVLGDYIEKLHGGVGDDDNNNNEGNQQEAKNDKAKRNHSILDMKNQFMDNVGPVFDNDDDDDDDPELHRLNRYQKRDTKITPFLDPDKALDSRENKYKNATNLEYENYNNSIFSSLRSLNSDDLNITPSNNNSNNNAAESNFGQDVHSPNPSAKNSLRSNMSPTSNNTHANNISMSPLSGLNSATGGSGGGGSSSNTESFNVTVSGLFGDLNASMMMSGGSLLFDSIHSQDDLLADTTSKQTTASNNHNNETTPLLLSTVLNNTTANANNNDNNKPSSSSPKLSAFLPSITYGTGNNSMSADNGDEAFAAAMDVARNVNQFPGSVAATNNPNNTNINMNTKKRQSAPMSPQPRPTFGAVMQQQRPQIQQQQQQQQNQQRHSTSSASKPAKQDTVQSKLQNLTVSERQRGTFDLHGMSELTKEDPNVIERLLTEMNKHIVSSYCHGITNNNHQQPGMNSGVVGGGLMSSSALGWAFTNHPEHVGKEKLRFLRAQAYDAKNAVKAMSFFYEKKRQYFGTHNLCKDINMRMLTDVDVFYLKQGGMQMLEGRDRSGRTVSMQFGKIWEFVPTDSAIRIMMYGSQVLCKDDRIQLAGYVHVLFAHGMKSDLSSKPELMKAKEMMAVRSTLPVRCVGKHFCYHNKNIDKSLYGVLVHALDPFQAIRFRFHYGTIQECVYNLMTYGILHDTIPITYREDNKGGVPTIGSGGMGTGSMGQDEFDVDIEFHLAFLEALQDREEKDRYRGNAAEEERMAMSFALQNSQQQQQQRQQQNQNQNQQNQSGGGGRDGDTVILPGPLDIIMGRGCHNKNKPGNIRLKNLLENHRAQYDTTRSKNEKTQLVQSILRQVYDSGSRFLIQDKDKPGMWTISSHQKAHDKIAHDFRNMRRGKASSSPVPPGGAS